MSQLLQYESYLREPEDVTNQLISSRQRTPFSLKSLLLLPGHNTCQFLSPLPANLPQPVDNPGRTRTIGVTQAFIYKSDRPFLVNDDRRNSLFSPIIPDAQSFGKLTASLRHQGKGDVQGLPRLFLALQIPFCCYSDDFSTNPSDVADSFLQLTELLATGRSVEVDVEDKKNRLSLQIIGGNGMTGEVGEGVGRHDSTAGRTVRKGRGRYSPRLCQVRFITVKCT
jgi:hypothetical protein